MPKLIRKQIPVQIREVNEAERSIDFVMTDETVDAYGDIIRAKGGQFERFLKNPQMPWSHNYREFPIGKWIKIWKEGKQTIGRAVFAGIQQLHEKAETAFLLYRDGFLNAISIGFRSIEHKVMESGGYEFIKWQLLEGSGVLIPANENALKKAVTKGIISSVDEIKDFFGVEEIEDRTERELKDSREIKGGDNEDETGLDDEIEESKEVKIEKLADLLTGKHDELKAYRKLLKELSEKLEVPRNEDELKTIAEVAKAAIAKIEKATENQKPKVEPKRTLELTDDLAAKTAVAALAKILFPR